MSQSFTKKWELTTKHPASSYGMPVFVFEEAAYHPRDMISVFRVADIVKEWADEKGRTDEEKSVAGQFLRQWPEGPQLKRVPGIMGRPRKFGKSELLSLRVPTELFKRLPKGKTERADFVRAAIKEKLDEE